MVLRDSLNTPRGPLMHEKKAVLSTFTGAITMPPARNHRRAHGALALVAAVLFLAGNSCAFVVVVVPRRPRGCCFNPIIVGSSTNDDDGGDVFFDDFGDGFADGGGPSPQLSGLLRTRMVEVRGAEAAYDAKLARNWRRGNWSVRGFSLDKSPASSSAAAVDAKEGGSAVVRVSVVAAPTSSSRDADISLPQDRALPRDLTVAVGRTDGSVFVVKLGDEYLTNFLADGGNVGQETDGAGMARLGGGMPREDESDSVDRTTTAQKRAPFEIKRQFLASDRGESIHGLVFHDSIEASDECGGIICTSAGTSGDISMWKLPYHDSNSAPAATVLSGVHGDQIVSLKTMVLKPRGEDNDERNVLFSASGDGKFALWNLDGNGELILSSQCTDVDAGKTTCADVFNPSSWDDGYGYNGDSDNDVIFLGTSSGYVFGYVLQELLPSSFETGGNSNIESVIASPNIRFKAHGTESGKGEAVTAIKCGGDGTIPTTARSSNPTLSSSILLTGGEDGSVKQW